MTSTTTDGANELRRGHLKLPDVIAQSVSVIAPGMSGALLTYLAATKAGGATPLAFVLAAVGAYFIGQVVSEFGKSMSSAGSLYTYTATGWSKTAGFVLGWVYSLAFVVLGAAVLAGFGHFMSAFFASVFESNVKWWVFFFIGLVFVAVMGLFNVRLSTRLQLVFVAATVLIMLVAALWVIGKGSPRVSVLDGTTPVAQAGTSIDLGAFWPSAAGVPWSGILLGFAFGILSFTGFEAGAVLAEETEDPKRNIPRAVLGSILVAGVFYTIISYATSIGFGVRQAAVDWPTSLGGLIVVAPTALGDLVLLVVAVSCLFCAVGIANAVTRFLYTMAREGVLPKLLASTHPKWKTPWNAVFANLVLWVIATFGALAVLSSETEIALSGIEDAEARGGLATFAYWATAATPGLMFCYCLLGVAGLRKGLKDGNRRLTVFGALCAVTGAIAVYGGLYYSFVGDAILRAIAWIPWVTVALIISGLAVAMYLKSSKPKSWEGMGAVFEE